MIHFCNYTNCTHEGEYYISLQSPIDPGKYRCLAHVFEPHLPEFVVAYVQPVGRFGATA